MGKFPTLFSDEEFEARRPQSEVSHYSHEKRKSPAERFLEAKKLIGEQYPRIFGIIKGTWGSPECSKYMKDLIVDPSRDLRQGFPPEILSAIIFLSHFHDERFGYEAKDPNEFKIGQ